MFPLSYLHVTDELGCFARNNGRQATSRVIKSISRKAAKEQRAQRNRFAAIAFGGELLPVPAFWHIFLDSQLHSVNVLERFFLDHVE
jgi:hypothetical protein